MHTDTAIFAGGCFWCIEAAFSHEKGVVNVDPGYIGGPVQHPSYELVCTGTTGHTEAARVVFDSSQVSYAQLLDVFWRNIDPTDAGGQFADRGSQYRTAIFYLSEPQHLAALHAKDVLTKSKHFDKPIVVSIEPADIFWPAEDWHRKYFETHPERYNSYKVLSGRDMYLKKVWKKENRPLDASSFIRPPAESLRVALDPLSYAVTQDCGTEPPFKNKYWNEHREGIYVDIVSGEVLFSSRDKFNSGTGWPSFTKALKKENVVEKVDAGAGMVRTEVKSRGADSHLGHVFNDGPAPTGLRYCINSAALRFVLREDMVKEGYGDLLEIFRVSPNSN